MAIAGLTTTVVTVAGREETLARTLAQLAGHGIQPHVFSSPELPAGLPNVHATALKALRFAQEENNPHTLYLEDDLAIAPQFGRVLAEVTASQPFAATFYLSASRFYPLRLREQIVAGQPYPPGLYAICNMQRWCNSQALLLSRACVDELLDGWEPGCWLYQRGEFDLRVRYVCQRVAGRLKAYAPNPVQHYGGLYLRSTWSKRGQPHHSISYQEERSCLRMKIGTR